MSIKIRKAVAADASFLAQMIYKVLGQERKRAFLTSSFLATITR
jgi:hypothetical protein